MLLKISLEALGVLGARSVTFADTHLSVEQRFRRCTLSRFRIQALPTAKGIPSADTTGHCRNVIEIVITQSPEPGQDSSR